ncbi:hypothetical protein WMY93_015819 [Mugilogobius chulae]|uniref:protein-tyrosine-phosphatase n=1 Tax=Mugilogobius chulae TaxID=88201 RepID=A0AAW0NTR6_9GOBI
MNQIATSKHATPLSAQPATYHRHLIGSNDRRGQAKSFSIKSVFLLRCTRAIERKEKAGGVGTSTCPTRGGSCTFDEGFSKCDYQQDLTDDFDWTHINTQEVPYVSPELPQGSYMFVDVSQYDAGEKARFQLPVMKENDTHCIDFNYLLTSPDGSSPGTLNVLVKVNKGPLANPIWNVTSYTGKGWLKAELAISTFWPNEYQVFFEAKVSDSKAGFIAVDDIQVLSYPCDKSPHFLRLGDVEVNAGQNATFQCIATGRDTTNNKLWLQVEYRMTSGTWTETHAVNSPNYKLWHLDPDTEYEIRVLLTRPGEGGTGKPGPPLITRTKCAAPRHIVGNLPPYTNVSLKMILTNPEGRKESDETIIQTDEDAHLQRSEILRPLGVPAARGITVSLPSNASHHLFSQLHPGVTYQLSIRASTSKGFGPATTLNVTTNISAPTLEEYDGSEAFLNDTATTITVLLKPAQAKGAPITAYQIVVEEVNPQRSRRQASSDCYEVPVSYHSASTSGSPYYYAAQLSPSNLPEPLPFTVGDNKTYQGFWNPPLAPRKNYNIYLQAVSSTERETKTQCLRLATKGATDVPEVIPDPEKRADRVVKIAGISAGVLVFILLVLVAILLVKKRRTYYSYSYYLKLAKKRKDAIGTTRQEMTHMVNAMDRSYADQSTLHGDDPMAVTFMDSHNYNNRLPNDPLVPTAVLVPITDENHTGSAAENSRLLDVPRYHCEGTESPYQTGQLHPAIRVADLLQHINLMKTSDSYRLQGGVRDDHSRVILQPIEDDPSSDYINANYIDVSGNASNATIGSQRNQRNHTPSLIWLYRDGYQRPSHYIATQGPVHETVYDFWRMVWQEQSACIVMVTNLVEVGRVKCYKYWPDDAEVYGDFKVTFVEVEPLAEYVVRTFTLERRGFNEVREVKQFHFTGWPDHGVPYHATGLLSFIRRVKISNPPSAGPIVVHCSGQEPAVELIYSMSAREETEGEHTCDFCVVSSTDSCEQYIFIHDAILEACLCGETAIPVCEFKAAFYELIRIDSQTNSSHLKDEFQTLNSVTPQPQPEDCSIALLPRNQDKNRFMDGLPPDRCLPFLITIDGESSNYINAALMDSYRQPAAFIVTQHPLPNTVKDFWRLVYDYGCTSLGCPQYWPEEGMLRYGPVQVECMSCSMDCDVISRLFRVCNLTRPQEGYLMVRQFQYLGWAGHREVPASKRSFLKLILQVDQWQREGEEGEGRTIVHCLNGGGRSGVFCACSIVCEMAKRQSVVDVFHAVKTLRNSKPNMVDTPEQYRFCYDLALEFIESSS